MVDRVTAKLEKLGKRYEIEVDCEKAIDIRNGKSSDIDSALLVDKIFKDIKKGEVAGNLRRELGTDDIRTIALKIIKEGEIQLSTAYKQKQSQMLKNRIIDKIAGMAIDLNTNLPIPRKRIELAMEDVHHNFDINKPEKEQLDEVLLKLKKILPIKLGELDYTIEIPIQYANDVMLYLKRLTNIKNNTRSDKSLVVNISVKAGNENELMSKIKSVTHGNINVKKI
ncbi:MAG: Shwachman-Bodian-Diamond syndrome protein [Candidatus Parvarchaeum acidophilus ARMAN-5_'5-way FS']|jgi:ribosome maturation protein SDO1|uniref:Shwachman-Bodian-Diamond syndrome protein n=2 Tax=Parvarchaeum acidophilus TaxID=662761 RepID=D6GWB2_PARA5|nr:MAG: Shwachman-Bodian-Diamond syndrome protein [Candidatus Parvarchaeum acidophilus ARMAN-5]EGD71886.1 MAG: Shwachman-Bodian-Diamond syndrome protein [Candidatus Parvarchaeum acidophilus ARMAN-5_'5-way FS']